MATAERTDCSVCDRPLGIGGTPTVRMGGHRYHSICWLMLRAPSVKAAYGVN